MTPKRKAPEKRAMWSWKESLELLGFNVTLFSQPFRDRQTKGIPDMYVRHPRWQVRLWVEAKAGKNKATADQQIWGERELEAGGAWIVAYSLQDILDALREHGAPIR